MKLERCEHKGSQIEIVERKGKYQLLVDGKVTKYGRFPNGDYFLDKYAYDPQPDLMKLAQRYVEYLARVAAVRRAR